MVRCSLCKLNERKNAKKASEGISLFVNIPGSIAFKAVFFVENHDIGCCLMGRSKNVIIAELNTAFLVQVKLNIFTCLMILWLIKTENNCVEMKVSSETMNPSEVKY